MACGISDPEFLIAARPYDDEPTHLGEPLSDGQLVSAVIEYEQTQVKGEFHLLQTNL